MESTQMAEAISCVPQISVIGPILFVIYVSADSHLYADDGKLIAPVTAMIFAKAP